jgi:hypothetical protein
VYWVILEAVTDVECIVSSGLAANVVIQVECTVSSDLAANVVIQAVTPFCSASCASDSTEHMFLVLNTVITSLKLVT